MVQVVILSGGLATRLRPMTETIPKSLVEINGEPFIFHQLRLLKKKGVSKILICTGYLGNIIEDAVGDGSAFGLKIEYSYDGAKLLGTGGAIRKAYEMLDPVFMVTYGDSYLDFDYQSLQDHFETTAFPAVMTVYQNRNELDKSNVVFEAGKLELYSKTAIDPRMRYIDFGISIMQKAIFEETPVHTAFDLSEVLEKLSRQQQLGAFEVTQRFYEIGSFGGITDLENHLRNIKSIT